MALAIARSGARVWFEYIESKSKKEVESQVEWSDDSADSPDSVVSGDSEENQSVICIESEKFPTPNLT